jgi:AraC family transcriptional regulator, regulatory protein of adaptative response / DNA-3-methyladenine glycosylase II
MVSDRRREPQTQLGSCALTTTEWIFSHRDAFSPGIRARHDHVRKPRVFAGLWCETQYMELPDKATCYKALESRDSRFDGLIFVGVKSTGIYCRPVCPARTAKYENCTFYGSAAGAQEAGYRPCLRCRPETAPQFASWRGTSNTVSRALALIGDGALDGQNSSVEKLAERLGVGERQLRRLFMQHLGASPVVVAQTRRVLFAKQLIHDTQMPMTEVALAAGFSSLRRFNEVFQDLFHRPPSALRRKSAGNSFDLAGGTLFRIRYRPPYDWDSMLEFLRARAIPGIEIVETNVYKRTVEIGGRCGFIEVTHLPRKESLSVTIHFPTVQALQEIVNRVRRLFDLGADIEKIDEHLSLDNDLGPWIAKRPGLRAPGGWDGFELAVRAILGQQVSVQAARQLAGKLVALHGKPMPRGKSHPQGLTHVFPTARHIAGAADLGVGMPKSRLATLKAVAQASVDDPGLFQPSGDLEEAIAKLTAVPGIGEWTAQYVALRIIREVDAFPALDIGLLRGAKKVLGEAMTPKSLALRAESWRPWRAYAAQHLWAADAARSPELTPTTLADHHREVSKGNRHELVL